MDLSSSTVVFVAKTHQEYERYCMACELAGFAVGDYIVPCRFKSADKLVHTPYCLVMDTFDSRAELAIEANRNQLKAIEDFCVDVAAAIQRIFGKQVLDGEVNVFVHWGGGSEKTISELELSLNETLGEVQFFKRWWITSLSSLRPELINIGGCINLPTTIDEFQRLIAKGAMGNIAKDPLTAYVCNREKLNNGRWLLRMLDALKDDIEKDIIPDSDWMLDVVEDIVRNVKSQVNGVSLDYSKKYAALFSCILQEGVV